MSKAIRTTGVFIATVAMALGVTASVFAAAGTNPECVNDGRDGSPFPAGSGSVTITSTGGQVSGAGATLFVDFFRTQSAFNDWSDVDNDAFRGFDGVSADPLAVQFLNNNITSHWMFQYRSVGSVNGFNEFVGNQTCGAKSVNIPSEFGLFNRFQFAAAGLTSWGGPFANASGVPVEPCEIEFSFLDVPSKWGVQVQPAGDAKWSRYPLQSGYGLNPVLSSSGFSSALQTLQRDCGTCAGGTRAGEPCTVGVAEAAQCPASSCTPDGTSDELNQFSDPLLTNDDTIFDLVAAWVPVSTIANRGTGVRDMKYTDLQYHYVTGRFPTGENLIAATRSAGSGTRNAYMNSMNIDTTWGRGDNVGNEFSTDQGGQLSPGTQPTNAGGSGNVESAVRHRRLAIGFTGLFGASRAISDTEAGQYEIINVCKDIVPAVCVGGVNDALSCLSAKDCPGGVCDPVKHCSVSYASCFVDGDCPLGETCNPFAPCPCAAPGDFIRPTCATNVLDNCDPCNAYQIGGNGSFVSRGNPDANRDPGKTCSISGADCLVDTDCTGGGGTCSVFKTYCMNVCSGGARNGLICGRNSDCPGGTCPAGNEDLECNVAADCVAVNPAAICVEKMRCDVSYRFCDTIADCVGGDSICDNEVDPLWVNDNKLDNQAVANFFNNIEDSIVAYDGTVIRNCSFTGNECTANVPDCQDVALTIPQTCETYERVGLGVGNYCSITGVACTTLPGTPDPINCPDLATTPSGGLTQVCNLTTDRCTLQSGTICTLDTGCTTQSNTCLTPSLSGLANTPASLLASTFTIPQGVDCTQTLENGVLFYETAGFNQFLQNTIRSLCVTTPAYNGVNPTDGGNRPTRNTLTGGNVYSDGQVSANVQWDGGAFVVFSGGRLARRNIIQGDANADCNRDARDAVDLADAYYTPRDWQRNDPEAVPTGAACFTGGTVGSQVQNRAIPEVIFDFQGDGSLTKEDLRYFADGLAMFTGRCTGDDGGCFTNADCAARAAGTCTTLAKPELDRKQGAISMDNAISALSQPFPWADPSRSNLVAPLAIGSEPTFNAVKDVDDVVAPMLVTGATYEAGDFRGDVAGGHAQLCVAVPSGNPANVCEVSRKPCTLPGTFDPVCGLTAPIPGAEPAGWDGFVDDKDIDYCCRLVGDWSLLNDAVVMDLSCDMDGNLAVNQSDIADLVEGILETAFGDVNLDGVVDGVDQAIVLANQTALCNGDASCGWEDGDTNCDGLVNASDLSFFAPEAPTALDAVCFNGAVPTVTPCGTNAACPVGQACRLKSRFLSINPADTAAAAAPSALQVTVTAVPGAPGSVNAAPYNYPAMVGDVWWVGAATNRVNDQSPYITAPLACTGTPLVQDWNAVGNIHIYGDGIVPGATYEIRSCATVSGPCSAPLVLATARHGDTRDAYNLTNFADISALVTEFSTPNAPSSLLKSHAWITPSNMTTAMGAPFGFNQISAGVTAFSGGAPPSPTLGANQCP